MKGGVIALAALATGVVLAEQPGESSLAPMTIGAMPAMIRPDLPLQLDYTSPFDRAMQRFYDDAGRHLRRYPQAVCPSGVGQYCYTEDDRHKMHRRVLSDAKDATKELLLDEIGLERTLSAFDRAEMDGQDSPIELRGGLSHRKPYIRAVLSRGRHDLWASVRSDLELHLGYELSHMHRRSLSIDLCYRPDEGSLTLNLLSSRRGR